jgi:hypothetical protein
MNAEREMSAMTEAVYFDDPVSTGSVRVFGDTYEEAEYHAALLWWLALTHQLEVGKVTRMALAIVCHLDPIDAAHNEEHTYDPKKEWRSLIEDAKWDRERLRELRQQPKTHDTLEEVVEIMQRNRARLEELMQRDPAHAEEIAAFLDVSAARIRKMVREHNRTVRQQRAVARMKEN